MKQKHKLATKNLPYSSQQQAAVLPSPNRPVVLYGSDFQQPPYFCASLCKGTDHAKSSCKHIATILVGRVLLKGVPNDFYGLSPVQTSVSLATKTDLEVPIGRNYKANTPPFFLQSPPLTNHHPKIKILVFVGRITSLGFHTKGGQKRRENVSKMLLIGFSVF